MKEQRTEQIGFRVTKRQHEALTNLAQLDSLSSPHEMARSCVEHFLRARKNQDKPELVTDLERSIESTMKMLTRGIDENSRIMQQTQAQIDQTLQKRADDLNHAMTGIDLKISRFQATYRSLDQTLTNRIYPLLLGRAFFGMSCVLTGFVACFLSLWITGWAAKLLS